MTRIETIKPEFVTFIPETLQEGVLYISRKYRTATHLCCCGCRQEVVTPLKPGGWQLRMNRDRVSLYPSIGSWSLPCRSHYWIRENGVEWARQWLQAEIEAVRASDRRALQRRYDALPLWRKVIDWVLALFR